MMIGVMRGSEREPTCLHTVGASCSGRGMEQEERVGQWESKQDTLRDGQES